MRSVLVELGPWEWPAVLVIAAILLVTVVLWRRVERALGDEPQPIDLRWVIVNGGLVAAISIGIFVAVNAFGPVPIRSYGVCLLIGFIGGYFYATRAGGPRGLNAMAPADSTRWPCLTWSSCSSSSRSSGPGHCSSCSS